MGYRFTRALLATAILATLSTLACAQAIPKQKGPARVVGLFNFLCLKHLPDLEGIERAAGFGEFDQLLDAKDLAPYATPGVPGKLLGWRYHDHGEEFILTASPAQPDDATKKELPALNAGAVCTLHVPNVRQDMLLGELTRAMGRKPDATRQEGSLLDYSWAHRQPNAVSYVHLSVPQAADAKARLSAGVFLKK